MKRNSRWSCAALLTPCTAVAADAPTLNAGDTAWMLTSTALVLFMTLPGLAAFYGGLVRRKNVLSILMQCVVIACIVSILWLVGVYALTFGDGGGANAWIGSLRKAFFVGIDRNALNGTIPETVFAMFQLTFAIITPALVIGSFAERIRFGAVVWFSVLWLIFVYAPIAHWVWGGGWLQTMGVLDFAGGIVVHTNAGVAAIVAAIVIGRRRGFPNTPMPPHNVPLTVIGAGMLWVGWFGFNAGSALAANGSAGMAMLVTHIGAASGSLAWMFIEWWRYGKPSVLGIVTGMVAGLGTITPASGYVGPAGALIIGIAAGTLCYFCTQLFKRKLELDDSLDVSPVHGVGGILGTLLTAIFVDTFWGGAGYAEGMTLAKQLGVQAIGLLAAIVWCAFATWLILKVIQALVGLRVGDDQETEGLDVASHGERGYET